MEWKCLEVDWSKADKVGERRVMRQKSGNKRERSREQHERKVRDERGKREEKGSYFHIYTDTQF